MTPVIKGYCTLKDLQEYYSLADLADMVEAAGLEAHVNEVSLSGEDSKNVMVVNGG